MTSLGEGPRIPSPTELVFGGIPLLELQDTSVGALIAGRAAQEPGRPAVRHKTHSGKWAQLTWGELDARRRTLAAGFAALGVSRGDRVALVSHNSAEMLVCELALFSLGAVSTPIFPDYGTETLHHCLWDCGARVVLCGSAVQQHKLPRAAAGGLGAARGIERVIVLDSQPLPDDPRALPLSALERETTPEALAAVDRACGQVGPDDLALLLYTSGTTGKPKGVELTHRNVLSQQQAMAQVWDVSERDIFLSYLPWHHCFGSLFERMMALSRRALLVLDDSRGRDLDRLLQNLAEVKPTVYFSVPRVYQGLVARAEKDPRAKEALLRPSDPGSLRFVFTAAAPLDAHCYRFFEENGVPVHEGWGLTETSPCVTVTRQNEPREAGVCGPPLPGTTVKLEEVPEAGGFEVLVRGPQVMRGYHGLPKETARVLSPDGFLRTGDLGEWTLRGLRIRGRVDGVFKLQNGEKIASGEVEARVLSSSPLFEQALVLGAGHPHVTALCWLNSFAARRYLEELGLEVPEEPLALTLVPELRRALVEALQANNLFASVLYERVRRIALVGEPLSLGEGELTPTQKLVRRVVLERHRELALALSEDKPHPQILVLESVGPRDAFENV